jgi:hypothetical protein
LSVRIDTVSNAVSIVSNALSLEIANRTSADNALSNLISALSNSVSVTYAPKASPSFSGNITTTGSLLLNTLNNVTAIVNSGSNGVGNIGTATVTFNTVFAKATTAQYADLAEKYTSDAPYSPGTVVVFGTTSEVTISTTLADSRVVGVVSTEPAYLMNAGLENGVAVALTGRVPCNVVGKIRRGDMLVTSHIPGVATYAGAPLIGTVIGKALGNYDSDIVGTIEVVVGRM